MKATAADNIRSALAGRGIDASHVTPVSGGDISSAYRVTDSGGRHWFVKDGESALLETESAGLSQLRKATTRLVVPEPKSLIDHTPGRSLLVLEWLESCRPDEGHWERLGLGLAELHRYTAPDFGFDQDNFIGRLPQANGRCSGWVEFFRVRRLEPQVEQAVAAGRWEPSWNDLYSTLVGRLSDLIPNDTEPALVHGDLWSGNAMSTVRGPAIMDPAVYFGHREVDLAMTELFGGFSRRFYSAYREANPLESGYRDRKDLYNLYHLLNHLNHFGGGYAASVDRVLRRYGG